MATLTLSLSKQSWQDAIAPHYPALRRYFAKVFCRHHDADDRIAECFAHLCSNLARLAQRGDKRVRICLPFLTRNVVKGRKAFASNTAGKVVFETRVARRQFPIEAPAAGANHFSAYMRSDAWTDIRQATKNLLPLQLTAEGHTRAEVARVLGVSPARVGREVRRLRRLFLRSGG